MADRPITLQELKEILDEAEIVLFDDDRYLEAKVVEDVLLVARDLKYADKIRDFDWAITKDDLRGIVLMSDGNISVDTRESSQANILPMVKMPLHKRPFRVHWTKTYVMKESVDVEAYSEHGAGAMVEAQIGDLQGNSQYAPEEDTIEVEAL